MISRSTIEEILERADIYEVISDFVDLKKSGSSYVGLCPFHSEKHPSFYVSQRKGIYKCFSCGESGGVVSFLKKHQGFRFPEAMRYLAERYHITISETKEKLAQEELELACKRESAHYALLSAQEYFQQALLSETTAARKAQDYAYSRWSKDYCEKIGIGFAPFDSKGFVDHMQTKGISVELLLELGLVYYNDANELESSLRNRVTIPDRNTYGYLINFTGRTLSTNDKVSKYKNLKDSFYYMKGNNLFGADVAIRSGRAENKIYIVEGAPDVLRLQILGYNNVVAPLGTSLTEQQLILLKRATRNIVFIPDADIPGDKRFGAGINAAIRSGKLSIEHGFNVKVKELPLQYDDKGCEIKSDPDSFFTEPSQVLKLPEEDYVKWYADKIFSATLSPSEINDYIKEVCQLLIKMGDSTYAGIFLEQYPRKKNGGKTAWTKAYRELLSSSERQKRDRPKDEESAIEQPDSSAGYFISNNCYCTYNKHEEVIRWSNFIFKPFYDVSNNGIRQKLFILVNDLGHEQLVVFTADDLGSIQNFRRKLNNAGSYIWFSKIEELMKVLEPAYANCCFARQISRLGLQKNGTYAFGNGLFVEEDFYPVDINGMVCVPDLGTFFLPAFSTLHIDNEGEYVFEKSFIYNISVPMNLKDYTKLLIEVFGDNAKVGIAYLIAALNHDIIFKHHTFFPILNIVGEKATGKSQLAMALRSFFIAENTPINIESQSFAACNMALSQVENALVHFDEYKNSISIQKLEMLKGAYDGVGRVKIRDGAMEYMSCKNGIILTGQEMTTLDIALFSRTIFLTTIKNEFSPRERELFEQLNSVRKKGLSGLIGEILIHRQRFQEDYQSHYKLCMRDVSDRLDGTVIEDRVLKNWVVLLASLRCMESVIQLPFDYKDLLSFSLSRMREQNQLCKQNNEVGNFWEFVYVLYQEGKIWENGDFKITPCSSIRLEGSSQPTEFGEIRRILFIRPSRILALYQKEGNHGSQIMMSKANMRQYLSKSKGIVGKVKLKFDRMIDGVTQYEVIERPDGTSSRGKKLLDEERCFAFDYDIVSSIFNINLISGIKD